MSLACASMQSAHGCPHRDRTAGRDSFPQLTHALGVCAWSLQEPAVAANHPIPADTSECSSQWQTLHEYATVLTVMSDATRH